MEQNKTFYITTTLPYVNAEPHVGFAMEFIRADTIARYKKLMGYEVFFNTGTDEHGKKLSDAAELANTPVQDYVNGFAQKFRGLIPLLGIDDSVHFIRTTDPHHEYGAQELWKLVERNGFIYKNRYHARYCVGCELEKQDSDLVDGRCPLHPNQDLEIVDEENYFFKFSAFQDELLMLYNGTHPKYTITILPDFRLNEVRSFVAHGLQDFSISRLKSKMSWGVPVPGDTDQVMYVWFDALANYITTLGWPNNHEQFEKFWVNGTPLQYFGQDNLRQQCAIWQAMLLAAGLPPTRTLVTNGFIMGEGGVKMSKSLGNVISPLTLIDRYGTEALRYYLLRHIHPFDGSPMSLQSFHEAYTANLVNGLGNLVSRIMTMASSNDVQARRDNLELFEKNQLFIEPAQFLEQFDIAKAMDSIWAQIGTSDRFIQDTKPFMLIKTDPVQAKIQIQTLLLYLVQISINLRPFMPETSKSIERLVRQNKKPDTPLFPRVEMQ